MVNKLCEKDIQIIHEAEKSVNLAVSSIQSLSSVNNPLLVEIGLDLLIKIKEIDLKLTRIALLSEGMR